MICQIRRVLLGLRRHASTGINWNKPSGQETGIRIYNCAAQRVVPVILPNQSYVTWYTCGPTVYDSSHLGHASCYVKLDIIQRIMRDQFRLNLVTAMNITDIDDKIIQRATELNMNWKELARHYETEFWGHMRQLNVREPNVKVRVTDEIPKIINFIGTLIDKGCAYVGSDSSVYFSVESYQDYGKLQKMNLEDVEDDNKATVKQSPRDFALWKGQKTSKEPAFTSPWGPGRPGWHIECSALGTMIFGGAVDFHAGGLDLRFPHHENEEAQCCVFHNTKQWVNYWVHTGQLHLKGNAAKMSKSLGNIVSIDEMLTHYTADEFRMACLLSHYRNQMDYSDEIMQSARGVLNKFHAFKEDADAYLAGLKQGCDLDSDNVLKNLKYAKTQVDSYIRDDFNTSGCLTVLGDQVSSLSRCINSNTRQETISATCLDTVAAVCNFIERNLRTFGLTLEDKVLVEDVPHVQQKINMSNLLNDILAERKVIRDRARANNSKELYGVCDDLRNCLRNHGIEVKDHPHGSSWSFSKTKSQINHLATGSFTESKPSTEKSTKPSGADQTNE